MISLWVAWRHLLASRALVTIELLVYTLYSPGTLLDAAKNGVIAKGNAGYLWTSMSKQAWSVLVMICSDEDVLPI